MKFIDPSLKEIYETLKNNNKLENFFIKNRILNNIDDYYENYGYNNNEYEAKKIIDKANDKIFMQLAEVLLANLEEIKSQSISELVAKRFLENEIKEALDFTKDVIISNDILWEIYYCIKYCYSSSFFQNNWEYFVPDFDYSEMQKNDSLMGFMDAIMKEFDKLDNIMSNVRIFKSYREIPYEYIVYLTQLMGIEPKDFMIMENQKEAYRTIAENIMDVYSVRGVSSTFELLFNFLGYNIKIEEYFFDRRLYFAVDNINTELTTTDIYSYKYYLTTKDPRDNLLDGISTNEIVTPNKMSEKLNVKDFDDLVDKYGLTCVLGYDDEYIVEHKDGETVISTDIEKYKGPVFKYFKTNYIRVKPSSKYTAGNLNIEQLYQVSALLKFLTPEFLQRETYVIIDTGETDETMVLNWTKDYTNDGFYILDSEGWNQNFANKFIIDYTKSDGYQNSGFSTRPYVLNDLGQKKEYENSVGKSIHFANNKYNNVFFNPLSEKIKIINSTKYWGDKVKISGNTEKLYPVYRISENYIYQNGRYYNPEYKIKGSQITEFYLPKDLTYLNDREINQWENMETVGLNGFNGPSLKNKIREMVYKNNSYYDYLKKSDGVINIDYVIEEGIKEFLDTSTDEENWSEDKKRFFEKSWKRVDNYTWKAKFYVDAKNTDFIKSFADKHKNIINYDYINNKLFCFNEFYNLSFDTDGDFKIVNSSNERQDFNNIALEIVNRIVSPGNYFIVLNKTLTSYIIYQYELINTSNDLEINKLYPIPLKKQNSTNLYTFDTYKQMVESIKNDIFVFNKKTIDLKTEKNINFYIVEDGCYYKPMIKTTPNKKIIHSGYVEKNIITVFNLSEISKSDKITNSELGSIYFEPLTSEEIEDRTSIANIKNKRENKIFQYKYCNIKNGILIYSKSEEKLYRVLNNGIFYTDQTLKVNGMLSNNKYELCVNQNGGLFGIEEINFYGRFVLYNDNDKEKAKIYEYDDSYYGFSEQDDDDNFIFNNYDRLYDWEKMKIYSKDIFGRRDIKKERKYKKDPTYLEISNKRPIKVNIDKIFEEKDENNIISTDILEEICESYGSNYTDRDVAILG
jgi:hypothetical protein